MTALPSQNGEVVGCVSSSAQWWFGSTFSRYVWEPHGCPTGVEGPEGAMEIKECRCHWMCLKNKTPFFPKKIPKVYDLHQSCG